MDTKNNLSSSKILGIEILKFIAAVMITNSHFKPLYIAPFTPFGTFGAPGNALFFFVSGYTLALSKRNDDFLNFYKRRINRIYPSLLSWSTLIGPLIFGITLTWQTIWLGGHYWFIHCIFIYYFLLYFVLKYFIKYLKGIFIFSVAFTVLFFFFKPITNINTTIYNGGSFHYVVNFAIMLIGVYCGKFREIVNSRKGKWDLILSITSLALFYIIQFVGKGSDDWKYYFQILSIFPLYTFVYYLSISVSHKSIEKFLLTKIGYIIRFIAALTLEIYLVGFVLIITKFNNIFPLNLIIVFLIIVTVAYLVKLFSNTIQQVFSNEHLNIKELFVIVK